MPDEQDIRDAYDRGRVEARTASHLAEHDRHLERLERAYQEALTALEGLRQALANLQSEIQSIREEAVARENVDKALHAQVKEANEKQISNRTFWLGVAAIVVSILVAFYAKSHGMG
jgi:chromosome segregation ATPase